MPRLLVTHSSTHISGGKEYFCRYSTTPPVLGESREWDTLFEKDRKWLPSSTLFYKC